MELSPTSVKLNALVNPSSLSTTVVFEWGITTSYGESISAIQNPVTGSSNLNVSANLTGLAQSTTYYVRAHATNSAGSAYADKAFSFIALSNFNNAFTKPSPLKAAILQIRLMPLIEANVMAIKI